MSWCCHFCYKVFETKEELDDHLYDVHKWEATDEQITVLNQAALMLRANFCTTTACHRCIFANEYICPIKKIELEIDEQRPLADQRRKGEAWYQHMEESNDNPR